MTRPATALMLLLIALLSHPGLAFDHRYTRYAWGLDQHVAWTADGHASTVDYAGLQQASSGPQGALAAFSAVDAVEFEAWPRARQMAFLINAYNAYNAYNAFTLKLILTKYPDLTSIREPGSLLRSPWQRTDFELPGQMRSLDWIEHERLRPRHGDARVHFAVNCASLGCPALRPEPYLGARLDAQLDAQLDDQMQRFLSETARATDTTPAQGACSYPRCSNGMAGGMAGGMEGGMAGISPPTVQAAIPAGRYTLDFLPYDRALNDRGAGT